MIIGGNVLSLPVVSDAHSCSPISCFLKKLFQLLAGKTLMPFQSHVLIHMCPFFLSRQPQVPAADGPDIFAFSAAADRFTETPYLSVEGLPPLTLKSHTRPPHTAFSMFHKLGEWAS